MIAGIVDFIGGGLFGLLSGLLGLLPTFDVPDIWSMVVDSGASQWLGWLNWLFPVGTAIGITVAWASCLLFYNVYLAFVSWLHNLK